MPRRGSICGGALIVALAAVGAAALPPPARAGQDVETIGGITYAESTRILIEARYYAREARCLGSKSVVSGGFFASGLFLTSGPFGSVVVRHSYPIDDGDRDSRPDDGWRAEFDLLEEATITVGAVCVDRRVGYEKRRLTVPSDTQRRGLVPCPVGKSAVAGGLGGSRHVVMNSSFPSPTTAVNWVDNITGRTRAARAFATCVGFDVVYQTQAAAVDPAEQQVAGAICPGGQYTVGGGVVSGGGLGESAINGTSFRDNVSPRWVSWVDNLTPSSESMASYAACSEPLD